MDWLYLLAVQGTLHESSPTTVQKHQFFVPSFPFGHHHVKLQIRSWYKPHQLRKVRGATRGLVLPSQARFLLAFLRQTAGSSRDTEIEVPSLSASQLQASGPLVPCSSSEHWRVRGARGPGWTVGSGGCREVCLQVVWFDTYKGRDTRGLRKCPPHSPRPGAERAGPRERWRQPSNTKHLAAGTPPAEGCVSGWPARLAEKSQ